MDRRRKRRAFTPKPERLPERLEHASGVVFSRRHANFEVCIANAVVGQIRILGEGGYRLELPGWRRGRTAFPLFDEAVRAATKHLVRHHLATAGEADAEPEVEAQVLAFPPPPIPPEIPDPPPQPEISGAVMHQMPTLPDPAPALSVPVAKKRGRPFGSKNKPKVTQPPPSPLDAPVEARSEDTFTGDDVSTQSADAFLLPAPVPVIRVGHRIHLTTYRLPLAHPHVVGRLNGPSTVIVNAGDRGMHLDSQTHLPLRRDNAGHFVLVVPSNPASKTYLTACDVTYFGSIPLVFEFRLRKFDL